ncbi:MAG: hypothetical protein HY892_14325 [Deltaproteobacteria bacterium]|nr:hypothetical protein [Deltaproteobacteria bacterium]
MKFCSFLCPDADNTQAQHAACLAVNGVYCGRLRQVIEKGGPCPAEGRVPSPKRKKGPQPNRAR